MENGTKGLINYASGVTGSHFHHFNQQFSLNGYIFHLREHLKCDKDSHDSMSSLLGDSSNLIKLAWISVVGCGNVIHKYFLLPLISAIGIVCMY